MPAGRRPCLPPTSKTFARPCVCCDTGLECSPCVCYDADQECSCEGEVSANTCEGERTYTKLVDVASRRPPLSATLLHVRRNHLKRGHAVGLVAKHARSRVVRRGGAVAPSAVRPSKLRRAGLGHRFARSP
eukprot:1774817-Prymnesium_polylepis.1